MKTVKKLGLAAILALALATTIAPSSALASGFAVDQYPAVINGNVINGQHTLVFGGVLYSCETSPEFVSELDGPALSLTPTSMSDGECSNLWLGASDLRMNGCAFTFNAGSEVAEGTSEGSFDIGPPGCGPIELDGSSCDKEIPSQTGINTITYSNKGEGNEATVEVEFEATGIEFKAVPEMLGCPRSGSNASYHGSLMVRAENEGEQVGIHTDATGVYMADAEAAFEAEGFPVSLLGEQDVTNPHALTIQGRLLQCDEVQFDSQLSDTATELAVEAEYDGCTVTILGTRYPGTVDMSSCHYVLDVDSINPYTGEVGVECTGEDVIEISAYNIGGNAGRLLCTFEIGSQAGLKGVEYSTIGEGSNRGINADFGLSGITHTTTPVGLVCGKSGSRATYSGSSTLLGVH